MDTLRALPGAVVEVLGWDEAFVGVETDDPEAVARRPGGRARGDPLHCSVGIGDTKVRAKIATDFGKPRGTFRLTRENWFEVMGDRPTGDLWGVGARISPASPRSASPRCTTWPRPPTTCWPPSSARRSGPPRRSAGA